MRLLLDTSAYSAFMRGHAEISAAVQGNELTGAVRSTKVSGFGYLVFVFRPFSEFRAVGYLLLESCFLSHSLLKFLYPKRKLDNPRLK